MEAIAHIRSGFSQKFGIPRQSGLAPSCRATIVFDPPYNDPRAVRGIEGFSHLWLIWQFEDTEPDDGTWRPLVRPPRLGGDRKLGVFATRSPFRPNALGLSCVRLDAVELTDAGPVLHVSGADLRDGTALYDIKPYVPLADCHPEATGGFTDAEHWQTLEVSVAATAEADWEAIEPDTRAALAEILREDPRPARTHHTADPKTYHLAYEGYDLAFSLSPDGTTAIVENVKRTHVEKPPGHA